MWNNPYWYEYLQDLSGFYVVLADCHANGHPTITITLCEPDTASGHAIGEKCHIVTIKSFVHHGQDGFPYFLIGVSPHTALNWRLLAFGWYQIAEGVPCGNVNQLFVYIWYKKVLGTKYCLAVELTRLCFSLGPCDSTLPASCPDWILGWTKKNRSHNGKYLKILIPSHTCAEKSHQVYHSSASCTSCTLFVARLWCILWSYSGIAECPQDLVILAFNCLGALTTIRCFSLAC